MDLHSERALNAAKIDLEYAESELDELKHQLRSFEARVDDRLGGLLDQLTELNAETATLDEDLRSIRDAQLFGTDLMQYLEGAPRPVRSQNPVDLPPLNLPRRRTGQHADSSPNTFPTVQVPDIKVLYRKLARRYHPDLARNDADRILSNEQMKGINQAYAAGDMPTLMRLAGIIVLNSVDNQQLFRPETNRDEPLSELERINRKLHEVRHQISRLSSLPIVKLSLDVKLARHQGRDLLTEMVTELQYKLARKMAERDYLRAQINASRPPPDG